jgi:hypothetical protein
MIGFMMIQKGTPEIINLIGLLLGILLCLLALNAFFEWLMTKPWKRDDHLDAIIGDENSKTNLNQSAEEENKNHSDQSGLFNEQNITLASNS